MGSFFGEVAAVPDLPFVMQLGEDSDDETDYGGPNPEDTRGPRAFGLLVQHSNGCRPPFGQCDRGKLVASAP